MPSDSIFWKQLSILYTGFSVSIDLYETEVRIRTTYIVYQIPVCAFIKSIDLCLEMFTLVIPM